MADCGCNSGGHGDWNQSWRAPLREALDWLRDEMAPRYEAKAGEFLRDPWGARNEYINVILDRSPESREKFFTEQAKRPLEPRRANHGVQAAGIAAARDADVHELRLVF